MRLTFFACLLLMFISIPGCEVPVAKTTEELAKIVVEGLKKDNQSTFQRQLSQDDAAMAALLKAGSDLDRKKDPFNNRPAPSLEQFLQDIPNVRKETIESWRKTRDKAIANGLNWSGVTIETIHERTDKIDSYAVNDVRVALKSGGTIHVLHIGDATLLGDRWFCSKLSTYKKN